MITDSRAAEIQDAPHLASLAEVAGLADTVQGLRDDLALATQDVDQARRGLAELAMDYARVTVRQQDRIRQLQALREVDAARIHSLDTEAHGHVQTLTRLRGEGRIAAERIQELTAEADKCHRTLDEWRAERLSMNDQIADLSGLVESLRGELEARKSQQSHFADELASSGARLEKVCSDLSKILDCVRCEAAEMYGSSGFHSASVLCDPKAAE